MRLANPRAEIRAAGGREGHLRALGALCLWPANSLFVEGYLTTRGEAIRETYRMIRDAGFEVEGNPAYDRDVSEGDGASAGFRLDGDAPLIRPDVARATRGHGSRAGSRG
jgi:biotin synthase